MFVFLVLFPFFKNSVLFSCLFSKEREIKRRHGVGRLWRWEDGEDCEGDEGGETVISILKQLFSIKNERDTKPVRIYLQQV